MLRRPARPALAAVTAAALSATVLLSGCGSEPRGDATSAVAAQVPAERVADAAPVAREDADLTGLLDDLRAAGEQLTTTRFQLAVRGDQRLDVTGALDKDGKQLQARLAEPVLGLREVRVVDGVAYALTQMGSADGSWIQLDLADLEGMLPDLGGLGDLKTSLADQLGDADDLVTDVTSEQTATGTTWTVDLDVRRIAGLLTSLTGSMGAMAMPGLPQPDLGELPASVPVTVAFDDAGRLSEVAAETEQGSITLTLTDPGAPVVVEAPAGALDLGSMGLPGLTPGG
ncbi:hypothetical protein [Nocardioides litoris]|uniref:hypothetical protein n=1 Tax=Nocardioides litoris TaxID=1926648 RepID=UPI0011203E3D|nr:hypothetical protein [Nocardioides litoris]